MTLFKGYDASTPGSVLPDDANILAAYVGVSGEASSPDTPHIWSADDWNEYVADYPSLRLLPIYVHSYPGDPIADADNAVEACLALGWEPNAGRLIACDFEMMIDAGYVAALGGRLINRGFRGLSYGPTSSVFDNPPLAGRWISQLTPRPPTSLPFGVVGCQWKFGTDWDSSVFDQFVYDNCGTGERHS